MSQANQSPKLSVAIVVRNGGDLIETTLASIHNIADEIVVLDTGSVDNTIEILDKYECKVFHESWQDSFSVGRNQCLSHVCGDWVLWLDAGEYLSLADAQQLRDFVEHQADVSKGYMMVVQTPASGPEVSGEQVARMRLLANHPAIQFRGFVRENVIESMLAIDMGVDGLPYRICRTEQVHQPQVKIAKAKRNIHLADLEVKAQGPQSRLLNCLGDAFQELNDKLRANQFFRHALDAAERGTADMLEAYYGLLTTLDGTENCVEAQLSICLEALEFFPLDSQLLCAMGGYLQAQGRLDLASRAYETAYRHGQVDPETWHLIQVQEIAAVCLSLVAQLQGEENRGLEILQEAITNFPDSLRLRRQLMEFHVKRGQRAEALEQLDHLPSDTPNREALRSVVRGACLAGEKNWISARAYLETGFQAGCRDPLCLRWLTVTLLSTGDIQKAKTVLQDWKELDPANLEVHKYLHIVHQHTSQQQQIAETPAPAADGLSSSVVRTDSAETNSILPMPNPAQEKSESETIN